MKEWIITAVIFGVVIIVALYIVYLLNQYSPSARASALFIVNGSQVSFQNLATGQYLSATACDPGNLCLSVNLTSVCIWTVNTTPDGTAYTLTSNNSSNLKQTSSTSLEVSPGGTPTPITLTFGNTASVPGTVIPGAAPRPIQIVTTGNNSTFLYADFGQVLLYAPSVHGTLSPAQVNTGWWLTQIQATT